MAESAKEKSMSVRHLQAGDIIVKNFILPAGGLVVFAFITTLFIGAEYWVASIMDSHTTIERNASCNVRSIEADGVVVVLRLRCGAREAYTGESKVVAAYVTKPKPLSCVLHKSGEASCKLLK